MRIGEKSQGSSMSPNIGLKLLAILMNLDIEIKLLIIKCMNLANLRLWRFEKVCLGLRETWV